MKKVRNKEWQGTSEFVPIQLSDLLFALEPIHQFLAVLSQAFGNQEPETKQFQAHDDEPGAGREGGHQRKETDQQAECAEDVLEHAKHLEFFR